MAVCLMVFAILVPVFAGRTVIRLLFAGRRLPAPLECALGAGVGIGLVSYWMLVLSFLRIPLTALAVGAPFYALFILYYVLSARRPVAYLTWPQVPASGMSWMIRLLIAYVVWTMFYIWGRAFIFPIAYWDEMSFIAIKAKFFLHDQSLVSLPATGHPTYPLLVELFMTWTGLNAGEWSDRLIKVICPTMLSAFLIVQYYFLRRWVAPVGAWCGLALLCGSNLLVCHGSIAYRDIVLMGFGCTAIMLLIVWRESQEDGFLRLAGLFAAFAAFTKMEGVVYQAVFLFAVLLLTSPYTVRAWFNSAWKYLTVAFPLIVLYPIYKMANHIEALDAGSELNLQVTAGHFLGLLKFFFLTGDWNVVWPILVLSLASRWQIVRQEWPARVTLWTLLAFLTIFFIQPLITAAYVWPDMHQRASRIILQFYPLAVWLIVFLNFRTPSRQAAPGTPAP